MKYDIVKVEDGNFFALDETGEKIIASTNEEHYKQAKVPIMKKEWFGEVATAIELETESYPIFKPILVDGVGLAYNATESYEVIKTDKNGFAILIKIHL